MEKQKALTQFSQQEYLNLETFRKTGEGVKTPVWFAEEDGRLYVRTIAGSGKVKRLGRNPRVRVAPCAANGALKGEWTEAEAREITDPAEAQRVNDLLNRKYGLLKRLFDLQGMLGSRKMTAVEITLLEK